MSTSLKPPIFFYNKLLDIQYLRNPSVPSDDLNRLFASAWETHSPRDFAPVLRHSLAYFCAFSERELVGFVNLAWDDGVHAFLLDTTVHPRWQGQGIGKELVRRAIETAREHGIEWVHVDYEPHLERFYRDCGFQPTLAGLVQASKIH